MELQQARDSLAEALASRERDQLAEQYRSYSRDLAGQAERLSKQLRRYQEENAKMVHREARLVQHVTELESKLQTFNRGRAERDGKGGVSAQGPAARGGDQPPPCEG